LMILPPQSSVFPSTTLFRSPRAGALARDLRELDGQHPRLEHLAAAVVGTPDSGVHLYEVWRAVGGQAGPKPVPQVRRTGGAGPRSEEHTSELQSRGHLVCRL